jgi:hypothetical protein
MLLSSAATWDILKRRKKSVVTKIVIAVAMLGAVWASAGVGVSLSVPLTKLLSVPFASLPQILAWTAPFGVSIPIGYLTALASRGRPLLGAAAGGYAGFLVSVLLALAPSIDPPGSSAHWFSMQMGANGISIFLAAASVLVIAHLERTRKSLSVDAAAVLPSSTNQLRRSVASSNQGRGASAFWTESESSGGAGVMSAPPTDSPQNAVAAPHEPAFISGPEATLEPVLVSELGMQVRLHGIGETLCASDFGIPFLDDVAPVAVIALRDDDRTAVGLVNADDVEWTVVRGELSIQIPPSKAVGLAHEQRIRIRHNWFTVSFPSHPSEAANPYTGQS